MMISRAGKTIPFWICVAALLYAAVALALFPRWTVDDAHITFRYSENWVRHGELNWNPGEDPVEGYTGVFLPAWIAAGMALGVSPFALARATGIISLFLAGVCLGAALRRSGARGAFAAGAVAIFMTAPFMLTHATSGLETTTFGLSIMLVALAFERSLGAPRRGRWESALAAAMLLCSLTRPEGALLSAMALAWLGVVRLREGREILFKFLARVGVIFIGPGLVYFIWRWNYYGYLLPNTFYAKSSGGLDPRSLRALGRFARVALTAPVLTALIPGVALWFLTRRLRMNLNHARNHNHNHHPIFPFSPSSSTLVLLFTFIAVVFVRYLFSIPVMNFSHRFYAQYYPAALFVIASLANAAWSRLTRLDPPEAFRRGVAGLAVAAAAGQVVLNLFGVPGQFKYAANYDHILNTMHVPIGRYLHKVIPSDEWIAVYIDVGAIGYYSQLKTIDMGALNDETLAHGGLSDAQAIDYLYARRPAAIVFTTRKPDRVEYTPEALDIPPAEDYVADPRFGDYVEWKDYGASPGPLPRSSRQKLFLRKDIAARLQE